MEKDFGSIFSHHKGKLSDKWSLYIDEWDEIFKLYQERKINLLEIGIHNGGSLEIYAKYFPCAKHIIGCDIDEKCQALTFSDPRITVLTGDNNSDSVENRIAKLAPKLDIIIDDGSHHSQDIIKSFCRYFKRLTNDGIYLIEDLHTSYWGDFEGGLYQPFTAMTFFKRLVDITNYEHWQNNQSREKHLLPFIQYYDLDIDAFDFLHIHSIRFINSVCVIQKRPAGENTLGKRLIVGSEDAVSADYTKYDGTTIHDLSKGSTDDKHLDVFSLLDETKDLINKTENLKSDLINHKKTAQHNEEKLAELEKSKKLLEQEIVEKEQSLQQTKDYLKEKEQILQQTKDSLKEKEQTLLQTQNILLDKDRVIESMKANSEEKSRKLIDSETKIKQHELIIPQLQNELAQVNQQIHEYHHQISSLNQQTQELKSEILYYAISKSWQLTRPLRKLMNLLRGKKHV